MIITFNKNYTFTVKNYRKKNIFVIILRQNIVFNVIKRINF